MWKVIGSVLELVFLIIKNIFENNATARKQNDDLHKEAKEAILSHDVPRINSIFDKLRNR